MTEELQEKRGQARERSVEGGALRRVSVSQVAVFDASTGGCPRRWWFQKVGGREEPTSPAQAVGTALHSRVERWLVSGEDVLCPGSRSARHLLPPPRHPLVLAEAPFGGVELSADDVPFKGKVDVLDFRDERAGPSGEPVHEPGVVAVDDVKTTKDVAKWAKPAAEVARQPQMVGYAELARRLWVDSNLRRRVAAATDGQEGRPPVDRTALVESVGGRLRGVRVSHVYAQTAGGAPRPAARSTLVLSPDQVIEGWARVTGVVREMRAAAAARSHLELEPNYGACEAYGGCPHRVVCVRDPARVVAGIFAGRRAAPAAGAEMAALRAAVAARSAVRDAENLQFDEEEQMSLMQKLKQIAGQPGRAEVDAARAELELEEAGARPVPPEDLEPDGEYWIRGERRATFVGSSKGLLFFNLPGGERVREEPTVPVYASQRGVALQAAVPPDAPRAASQAAAPSDASRAAAAAAEAPRAASPEQPAAATPARPGQLADGRCESVQRELDLDELATKKARCAACGAEVKVKPQKLEGRYYATLPAHPRAGSVAPPPPPPPPPLRVERQPETPQPPAEVVHRGDTTLEYEAPRFDPSALTSGVAPPPPPPPPPPPRATQLDLDLEKLRHVVPPDPRAAGPVLVYVDCVPDFERPASFGAYVDELLKSLEAACGAMDVRCAPKDSALAFGGWKGALAAAARERPPAPGAYVAAGSSETQQVALEAVARVRELRVVRATR